MAASGARHGVAAGGSAGEGQQLDGDESRRLVGIVADEATGAVPVIAGTSVDSGALRSVGPWRSTFSPAPPSWRVRPPNRKLRSIRC
jgi:hypothetical protein